MKYSVGIIGLGRIAWTLEDERQRRSPATHAEAFRQNLTTELAAASSSRREVLDSFGKKYGVSQLFEDYREMLEKVDLDIVAVCTHTPLHHQMVLDAARRGVRAILCEKPLSSSLEEADEMIDACRKSKTLLLVNHTRRWDANYVKAKQLIDSGKIGDLLTVSINSITALSHSGTHALDIMRFYAGDADWVCGTARKDNGLLWTGPTRPELLQQYSDPGGAAFVKFKGGAMGLIAAQHPYMIFEMELLGSEGRIKESGNGQSWTMWSSKKSDTYHGFNELVEELFPRPQEAAKTPLAMAVANVVNALEGREFTSTGEDARAALELVMAIRESGELGEIVRLPLKNRKRRILTR